VSLVAVVSNSHSSIILADSRLEGSSRAQLGDVSQKVTPIGEDGLIGFAEHVITASRLRRSW